MIVPPYLKKGDKIGLVCTARKISLTELDFALKVLHSWGLEVVLGKSIGQTQHQFAGSDAVRIADFQSMLDNPDIKAILCARGGYGTVRLIDHLDFSGLPKQAKWIIGYSDITVLCSHVHQNFDLCSLHATMPISFSGNTEAALQSLQQALFGKNLSYTFAADIHNRQGRAKASVVGGNLSLLYSLLGSSSGIDTAGKMLFLEDLDEYLYHIDRMMMNLKRNGLLHNLAGLLVGGMTDMNDNTTPFGKTAIEIIQEHTQDFTYPVAFNFPAGHWADNRAIIIGAEASLVVGETEVVFKQDVTLAI